MQNNTNHPVFHMFQDENMNACFNGLPPLVQETIMQSGAKPRNEEQLKNLAEAFGGSAPTNSY